MQRNRPGHGAIQWACSAVVVGGLAAAPALADKFDLTTAGSSAVVNGARFETADFRPAGTGYIDPFVRIQMKGKEQGYNTSGRPVAFDEKTDGNFTRNLQLGELAARDIGGTAYYEFLLDINESNGNGNSLLSLDKVQIYTSTVGSQTTKDVASLGTLRYDLDLGGDNWILLDYRLNSGSGQGDMRMLVPVSAFGDAGPNSFVYLYSAFGHNNSSEAGFEEWAAVVPLPPAAWSGLTALAAVGALGYVRRRRLS